jgi:hypothetical protein
MECDRARLIYQIFARWTVQTSGQTSEIGEFAFATGLATTFGVTATHIQVFADPTGFA